MSSDSRRGGLATDSEVADMLTPVRWLYDHEFRLICTRKSAVATYGNIIQVFSTWVDSSCHQEERGKDALHQNTKGTRTLVRATVKPSLTASRHP